jgi:hypothetical protein
MSQPAVVKSRSPRLWATSEPDGHPPRETLSASPTTRPDPLYHTVLLLVSVGVLLAAFVLSIRNESQVVLPLVQIPLPELCAARQLFGLSCPGCGLTRSFISLAHGDIATAWSYNPAGVWLFAILALQIPFRSIQLCRIRSQQTEFTIPWAAQFVLLILAVALLSQWTLRLAGVSF